MKYSSLRRYAAGEWRLPEFTWDGSVNNEISDGKYEVTAITPVK